MLVALRALKGLKHPKCKFNQHFSKNAIELPLILKFDLKDDILNNKSVQQRHLLNTLIAGVSLNADTQVDIHFEGDTCYV